MWIRTSGNKFSLVNFVQSLQRSLRSSEKEHVVDLDSVGSETLAGSGSRKIIADTDPSSSGSKAEKLIKCDNFSTECSIKKI
jgi:hypothetical protein